jgi:hypothetical protein
MPYGTYSGYIRMRKNLPPCSRTTCASSSTMPMPVLPARTFTFVLMTESWFAPGYGASVCGQKIQHGFNAISAFTPAQLEGGSIDLADRLRSRCGANAWRSEGW